MLTVDAGPGRFARQVGCSVHRSSGTRGTRPARGRHGSAAAGLPAGRSTRPQRQRRRPPDTVGGHPTLSMAARSPSSLPVVEAMDDPARDPGRSLVAATPVPLSRDVAGSRHDPVSQRRNDGARYRRCGAVARPGTASTAGKGNRSGLALGRAATTCPQQAHQFSESSIPAHESAPDRTHDWPPGRPRPRPFPSTGDLHGIGLPSAAAPGIAPTHTFQALLRSRRSTTATRRRTTEGSRWPWASGTRRPAARCPCAPAGW